MALGGWIVRHSVPGENGEAMNRVIGLTVAVSLAFAGVVPALY